MRVRACHGKLEQGKLVLEQKPLNYELLCCSLRLQDADAHQGAKQLALDHDDRVTVHSDD